MIKYLDMENASIEIDYVTANRLIFFLESYGKEIIKLNFKRLLINIDEIDLPHALLILEGYSQHNLNFKSILTIFTSYMTTVIKLTTSNVAIVNTNEKYLINSNNYYNLIALTTENIPHITQSLREGINIIVNPCINVNSIKLFNDNLTNLFKCNPGKSININGYLVPSALLKEHPCNAYLCNGWVCGKKISMLPRQLYINKQNHVYPHKIIHPEIELGILKKSLSKLLEDYKQKKQYKLFIEINKRVFITYLPHYPYYLMPFIAYFEIELQNYELSS